MASNSIQMTSTWPHPRYAVAPPARIASTHVVAQPPRPFFRLQAASRVFLFPLKLTASQEVKTEAQTSELDLGNLRKQRVVTYHIFAKHLVTEVFIKGYESGPVNGTVTTWCVAQWETVPQPISCWQCKTQHLLGISTSHRPLASRHVFFFLGLSASL